ncbi:hypothetical protein [[Mycobacterium] zoologicum]|uniref:hypothetical protein n=1 Tax=[Mycobacterium] zoologicum TaxID=2872311 RepID=UPI001CDB3584|nr:hypothetical protein [Mycolicibacter sp. MYC101]MEB3062482.1 hypothetical protein [Mycolicibacter sp. MYC101]
MRKQRRKPSLGRRTPTDFGGRVQRSRVEIEMLPVRLLHAHSERNTVQVTQIERELLALSKPDLVRAVAAAVTLWLLTIDPGRIEIVADEEAS